MNNIDQEELLQPAANKAAEPDPAVAGIDSIFHPIVRQYTREMFLHVMAVGSAGQALTVLGTLAQKHQSRHSMNALEHLAGAFNLISMAHVSTKGWKPEELAQCDRDIQRTWSLAQGTKSSILLPH